MNKIFIKCLIGSIVLHIILFLNQTGSSFTPKLNFSKKVGKSQIKARITIFERKEQKADFSKKMGVLKKKKKVIAPKKKKRQTENSKATADTGSEELITQYLSSVRGIIAQNKFKKRMARKLKMTGSVKLNFKIKAPNTIVELKIIEHSKFKQLDDSAMQTIESVKNIPVIPRSLNRVEIPVTLVISYE
ncbi:MAG: TonB family protein [Bacteriovoracaceae bacterium]|jgi:TonB family protein